VRVRKNRPQSNRAEAPDMRVTGTLHRREIIRAPGARAKSRDERMRIRRFADGSRIATARLGAIVRRREM
jgi:hypothetical protein